MISNRLNWYAQVTQSRSFSGSMLLSELMNYKITSKSEIFGCDRDLWCNTLART